ncbi:5'/3'-nucleotidase SurE [Salininema proteolyticum]|uniref:5'-nucleotidase n=1 Tax=Salininema proteolyticum TaxID=1607685 RepID=A0ABV8U4T9_9ACTN
MRPLPERRRRAAALAATALLALTACTGQAADDPPDPNSAEFSAESLEGMRILMGNDDSMRAAESDGSDGLGLYALRSRLCEAGADVVVFSPWGFQSSKSGAISHGGDTFSLGEPEAVPERCAGACQGAPSGGAVYGVCLDDSGQCAEGSPSATPVDAITFGVQYGLGELVGWEQGPDLVVSGVNSGPNLASQIPTSGTFAVAEAAHNMGLPAIALSANVNEDLVVDPDTYDAAAGFGGELVSYLEGSGVLTSDYVVSVNYPDAPDGEQVSDLRFTEAGTGTVLVGEYEEDGGAYTMSARICEEGREFCRPEEKGNSDFTATFAEGAVSVSALSGDRTYGSAEYDEDSSRLRELIEYLDSER